MTLIRFWALKFGYIYLRSSDCPNTGGLLFDIIHGIQYSRDMNEYGNIEESFNFGFKSTFTKNELRQSYQSSISQKNMFYK